MPNLAAFRYRNVMAASGGPVERIELTDITLLGRREFQANAFLRPELVAWKSCGEVFSDAAGSGTAESPMVARFKAVSESLERWAHMAVISSDDRNRYGFDEDPSSNGMAAFPGLRARQAREAAVYEAAERFNILSWWEGRLGATECPTPWAGVTAAVLCSEVPGVTTILFRRSPQGHVAYGHAAGPDFRTACLRAAAEMERHDLVLRHYALAHVGTPMDSLAIAHPIERRSVYFSQDEGHEFFLQKLRSRPTKETLRPRMVFDGEIRGPWSRYANVWRAVYSPPSDRFLSNDPQYFFW